MPGEGCKDHKAHTPIVSERQRRFFGAELGRREAGEKTRTGMSEAVLRTHLREAAIRRRMKKRK